MIMKESMSVLNSSHTQRVRDAAFTRWGLWFSRTREPQTPRKGLAGLRKHACSCLTFLEKAGESPAPPEAAFPF